MTNIDDGIDDYFNDQLAKGQFRQKPGLGPRQIRARFYLEGIAHGTELERDRIINLLDKNLGNMDLDNLLKLIKEEA